MKKQKKTNYKESNPSTIKIEPPKGRPMLHWAGKKPLEYIKSFPEQLVEVYNPINERVIEKPTFDNLKDNWQNLLFHGDNKEVLGYLLCHGFRGKIDLIYTDPPFDSGADYIRKVKLRGIKTDKKYEGEEYNLGEQVQYFDIWNNDGYLQFMYERLILMKELLSETGSLYLHCDWHKGHYLRCILDEIFGRDYFRNEIVWYYEDKFATGGKALDKNHDIIYHYSKGKNFIGNEVRIQKPEKTKRALRKKVDGKTIEVLDEEGNKIYAEYADKIIDDVWQIGRTISSSESYEFPTQKKEDLIKQLLEYGSNSNNLVLDCFIGSGTTAAASQKFNRRWIGCDINKGAVQTTSKRVQDIISEQIKEADKEKSKLKLYEDEVKRYFTFATYKVNDYDLKLLHTEAIELAIEHLGIQRTKTDNFFDGTRGKKLVKMIDFNHPLSMMDLQLIKDELKKRPNEDRNVTVVCLGKELSTDNWIKDYNKKHPVNKLEVIELRTDSKYGKFLIHEPCKAKVGIKRNKNKALIEIKDFISPSIIERLNSDENLFKIKIPDFRSMIDVVLIDKDYDGKVFNIFFSDVPEKKNDLVKGSYEIDIPKEKVTIAVKIIDMLGEELLIIKTI